MAEPVTYLGYSRHGTCHGHHFDGGRHHCLAKIKIFMYSLLNLYSAPHARDGTRLDGARDNKQVWSLAPPCSNLRSFRSKWTVLKKALVTMLGLFGALRSESAPHGDSGPGKFFPLTPSHYASALCIRKLQSCINTAPFPKALSWACYA